MENQETPLQLPQQKETAHTTKPTIGSRKPIITFLIWALALSNLFFDEHLGLNALIASLISIPIFAIVNRPMVSPLWWIAALIWLTTAFGVFINPTAISIISYFLAFMFFASANSNQKVSLPFGLIQSIGSFVVGIGNLFANIFDSFDSKQFKTRPKKLINVLIVTIPILIGIIFLKLYQSADETFYELTKFINLDWISWNFIIYYALFSVCVYGFYFFTPIEDLQQLEEDLSNSASKSYTDKIERFFGSQNELKIAISILISLNLMLFLYNAIDIRYILIDLPNPNRDLSFSEIVHGGINSLITSLILVIVIISFFFRGSLNFAKNKYVKILSLIWLTQNALMIITTSIKNVEYVNHWGFTHKRIGVYIYLFLALVGICLTAIKILKKKSIWFLLRNSSLTFAIILTSLLTFNWNRFIASYNLSHVQHERIDFDYLLNLGPDTYASIIDYHQNKRDVANWVFIQMEADLAIYREHHFISQDEISWRSYNWNGIQLNEELKNIKFKFQ